MLRLDQSIKFHMVSAVERGMKIYGIYLPGYLKVQYCPVKKSVMNGLFPGAIMSSHYNQNPCKNLQEGWSKPPLILSYHHLVCQSQLLYQKTTDVGQPAEPLWIVFI